MEGQRDGTAESRGGGSGDEAIVIGGSMAGLLAARVLADHLARVTLVERDQLPDGPMFRAGVPQSCHLHVLLAHGLGMIEQCLPGFTKELLADGAVMIEWPRDVLWLTPSGWSPRYAAGLPLLCASRELVEWGVRRRLHALTNLRILTGREVTGLLASADGSGVAGARLRTRPSAEGETGSIEELPAQLVVDASGRHSGALAWLKALGYAPPAETTINSFLGYASRVYAIPADIAADWNLLYLQAKPPAMVRGGALMPIEGNRWMVTLAGAGRDYPPTDEEGFLAFARALRSPVFFEAIHGAEPLTPIHGYRRTENRRRFYERLARLPERFLITGDAVCAFNPVYGQGMTAAAQSALVLDRLLGECADGELTGLPHRFQRATARVNDGAWLIATGSDLRYPATDGGTRNLTTRLTDRYLDRVIGAATRNEHVNRALIDVLQLIARPPSLFRPSVLVPALLSSGAEKIGPPPTTPSALA